MALIIKKPIRSQLPLWLKLAYTAFIMVLVPVYWNKLGVENFLWASDIALLITLVALWLENRFLVSMMAVGLILPEMVWNIDFLTHLVAGRDVVGLDATGYMFRPDSPLFVRSLSLFHVFLPVTLVYALFRLGYDSRAIYAQTLFTWLMLPVTFLITEPERNINFVFGIAEVPQTWMPAVLYLFLHMLLLPLLVYLPTHLILTRIFKK